MVLELFFKIVGDMIEKNWCMKNRHVQKDNLKAFDKIAQCVAKTIYQDREQVRMDYLGLIVEQKILKEN